jgi:hypothetical protein
MLSVASLQHRENYRTIQADSLAVTTTLGPNPCSSLQVHYLVHCTQRNTIDVGSIRVDCLVAVIGNVTRATAPMIAPSKTAWQPQPLQPPPPCFSLQLLYLVSTHTEQHDTCCWLPSLLPGCCQWLRNGFMRYQFDSTQADSLAVAHHFSPTPPLLSAATTLPQIMHIHDKQRYWWHLGFLPSCCQWWCVT